MVNRNSNGKVSSICFISLNFIKINCLSYDYMIKIQQYNSNVISSDE